MNTVIAEAEFDGTDGAADDLSGPGAFCAQGTASLRCFGAGRPIPGPRVCVLGLQVQTCYHAD